MKLFINFLQILIINLGLEKQPSIISIGLYILTIRWIIIINLDIFSRIKLKQKLHFNLNIGSTQPSETGLLIRALIERITTPNYFLIIYGSM